MQCSCTLGAQLLCRGDSQVVLLYNSSHHQPPQIYCREGLLKPSVCGHHCLFRCITSAAVSAEWPESPWKYQAKYRVERREVTKIRTKSPVIKKYCVSHTKGGRLCTIISHTCSRGCCILFSRRGNRNWECLNNLLRTLKTFGLSTISCSPLPSHPAKMFKAHR